MIVNWFIADQFREEPKQLGWLLPAAVGVGITVTYASGISNEILATINNSRSISEEFLTAINRAGVMPNSFSALFSSISLLADAFHADARHSIVLAYEALFSPLRDRPTSSEFSSLFSKVILTPSESLELYFSASRLSDELQLTTSHILTGSTEFLEVVSYNGRAPDELGGSAQFISVRTYPFEFLGSPQTLEQIPLENLEAFSVLNSIPSGNLSSTRINLSVPSELLQLTSYSSLSPDEWSGAQLFVFPGLAPTEWTKLESLISYASHEFLENLQISNELPGGNLAGVETRASLATESLVRFSFLPYMPDEFGGSVAPTLTFSGLIPIEWTYIEPTHGWVRLVPTTSFTKKLL